jgi:outer membrane protein assembly factor BamB
MSGQHRLAPSPELRKHWLIVRGMLVALIAGLGLGSWWLMNAGAAPAKVPTGASGMDSHWPGGTTPTTPATTAQPPVVTTPTSTNAPIALTASGPGWLQAGSDPSVLPGPVLIADGEGNRVLIIDPNGRMMWQFPRAGDLAAGQSFKLPEVAWFSPDGRQVVVASEDTNVLYVIDIATHKIVHSYGKGGDGGSGPNQVSAPDGVVMLKSGDLLVPDAGNCRIIQIPAGGRAISRQLGQTGRCEHNPPQAYSDPSGLFPMTNGNYVLTEGVGHYVSEMSPAGKIAWTVQVPGVSAIYQTAEIGPDRYLTVDHVAQGQVLTFDHTGKVLWHYAPTGAQSLNKPSLAIALPNGDIMVSDKVNNRLIVVDPRTNKVVWQYGHTKVPGAGAGFLNNPTGMDLYPPNSIAVKIR